MRTIWQSLAWKEWHEHKWSLVSILAILCGVAALVAFNVDERNLLGAVLAILMLSVVPLAIFIGMGAAAGERSRGTLPFLQSLPVPLWQVALHKFVAGLVTIVVPASFVVTVTFGSCQFLVKWGYVSSEAFTYRSPGYSTADWLWKSILVLSYLAFCFFIWTAAAGVNRKDEIAAAAVALMAMLGWAVALTLVGRFLFTFADPSLIGQTPFNRIVVVGVSTLPGGLIPILAENSWGRGVPDFRPLACLVAAAVLAALTARYVRRFGNISDVEIRSPMAARSRSARLDWLGPPRRSAFTAIAWKQFREGWLVALAGLVVTFGLFAAIFLAQWREFAGNSRNQIELINSLSGIFGFVVAMILGVSVFSGDVSPGLNTFWRSRPIHADMWFWIKFLAGLMIAVAAIYLPVLLIVGMDGLLDAPNWSGVRIAQVTVFAAAVAMICLVRQTVYAAILSIAVVYLGIVATAFARSFTLVLRGKAWPKPSVDFFDLSEAEVIAGLLVTFVFCTLLAWLAVRNDWGQKSRN